VVPDVEQLEIGEFVPPASSLTETVPGSAAELPFELVLVMVRFDVVVGIARITLRVVVLEGPANRLNAAAKQVPNLETLTGRARETLLVAERENVPDKLIVLNFDVFG
jgi:hypothetical protein